MLYHHDYLPENQSIVPFAKDYQHGDIEPDHHHNCAQLIHCLSGVVQINTRLGSWVVPPGRGVWLPARVEHNLRFTGKVAVRTLFVDPLARADLPAQCQVVQISPLLRELIVSALDIPANYASGGREERIMELILDELRMMPMLPLHLPEPRDRALLALCQHIQGSLAQPWTLEQAARHINVSGRTLARRFQRETGLRYGDWLRRARLLAALNALASGHSVLSVALDLGYDSPSAFSAMFRRQLGVAPSVYFSQPQPVVASDSAPPR
ncbi:AraC family transcriptional regulator [Serratia odorifera]|jgi:AraC-like DNA-binding protein|uniref:Arabinose operon regulatory protein n=2 Tax=Serratia odorifera TaxID=618 RepID=D4E7R5_SEROD|nr:helix-turn-helix transcriptional regulator [Serratia odorifera]EFE94120.1 transcriptional regulator, AraC family [Serratia odorifera DSM 4582]MBJ2063761.1 helix-turn-helix transcriptional regulator [Serratia odorifera]PNK89016.1 AraC family transcriptional regulator [Serratia odorifera]RII69956.1 AraC family transcriptional regulator [Serratia odorifera]VDZ64380.1 HTH-type transcriptional repressor of iron proteins A [Serratia odorifera]